MQRSPAAKAPRLPVFLWNVFSVSSVGCGSSCHRWRLTVFALLLASSAYNIYVTPDVVCALESNCDHTLPTFIKGLFLRAVAGTCVMSRLAVALTGGARLARHERNVAGCRAVAPPSRADTEASARLSHWLVVGSLLLTVPVNTLRLCHLVYRLDFVPLAFAFMYAQNFSIYCVETHFTVLCFGLYQNFASINAELAALRPDTVVRNQYPSMLSRMRPDPSDREPGAGRGRPTAAAVERLKVKHRMVREAANSLNDAFGVHMGLSMCSLCLYAMFDLYYHMVSVMNSKKTRLLIYGWILQYAVRFGSVTTLAYMTTQQALKTKVLITDINNRQLQKNTKEELQLFLSQISNCEIEFTACDFFTLDTRLITSAVAAITTYLVILLQFGAIIY